MTVGNSPESSNELEIEAAPKGVRGSREFRALQRVARSHSSAAFYRQGRARGRSKNRRK